MIVTVIGRSHSVQIVTRESVCVCVVWCEGERERERERERRLCIVECSFSHSQYIEQRECSLMLTIVYIGQSVTVIGVGLVIKWCNIVQLFICLCFKPVIYC